jgi:hypothetical protein
VDKDVPVGVGASELQRVEIKYHKSNLAIHWFQLMRMRSNLDSSKKNYKCFLFVHGSFE